MTSAPIPSTTAESAMLKVETHFGEADADEVGHPSQSKAIGQVAERARQDRAEDDVDPEPASRSVRWKYDHADGEDGDGHEEPRRAGEDAEGRSVLWTCHSCTSCPMTSNRSPGLTVATTIAFETWSAA